MSVKLSDFASGVTLTDTDHVVGYSNTNTGGERKWTVANLRNSLITGAATTIDTEYIDFTPLAVRPAHFEGKIYWYDNEKTLELQTENANFNLN